MTQIIANPPSPVPPGLTAAIEAAGYSFAMAPNGWETRDVAAVQAIIDSYVGSAAELAYHKAQAIDALVAKYESIIAAGRVYSVAGGLDPTPHNYQIDEVPPIDTATGKPSRRDSQSTMTTMASWAANVLNNVPGAVAWPSPFAWRDAANNMVPMTAAQCFAFTQNIGVYVAGTFGVYAAKYAQITGAADVAAVAAIDVTAGWLGNP